MKKYRRFYTIGSTAIKILYPDFKREPFDLDMLAPDDNVENIKTIGSKVEYHNIAPLYDFIRNITGEVTGDIMLTLKASHLSWNIKWDKHFYDCLFLVDKGCKIDQFLYYLLKDHWVKVHGVPKHSDLTLTAEQFFDNALKTYDHDQLHALLTPEPTYKKVLKDGSEVEPDPEKFMRLNFEDKLNLVHEEICVMAYERMGPLTWQQAYHRMMKKFIREHAPSWLAIFIIENYKHLHKPFFNYKKHLDYELTKIN